MESISKYFWIAFIFVTILNIVILRSRVQIHIDKNPDLKKGYDMVFKNILIFGLIPWVIMGIGILSGATNTVFDYLNPRAHNPFVIIFHVYILMIDFLLIRWIYFMKGAEFLCEHPGLIQQRGFGKDKDIKSPIVIKLFFGLALVGGIVGLVSMWMRGA